MDQKIDTRQLNELVVLTAEQLKIKYPFVIEKDYYVTQVIHTLSNVENDYFRLVFCGGTCLAKAHNIVKRMSEDVDFKMQLKNNEQFSHSRLTKELKIFRSQIQSALAVSDFTMSNNIARNEGKYQRIELNYPSLFSTANTLRPHILLEFTFSTIRLPVETLIVKTIIENTLEKISLFAPAKTYCISVEETAIEKWVGLTRKIIAIERQYYHDDKTLIRHVYDLNAIKKKNKITDYFYHLAKTIVDGDAEQFKTQHPEYFSDPVSEIKKSLELLRVKSIWKERYQEFIETMVYDETSVDNYKIAIQNLSALTDRANNELYH